MYDRESGDDKVLVDISLVFYSLGWRILAVDVDRDFSSEFVTTPY
jgi:hypothetical protein